jgi:filamentous hemagglutinin family protein
MGQQTLETGFLGKIRNPADSLIKKPALWGNWAFRCPTFAKSRASWAISITLGLATGCLLAPTPPALAQLIEDTAPDRALGTTVTPFNQQIDLIDGGVQRGQNLFHSFQDFNIGAGGAAYFRHVPEVQNILTRVTGGNPSRIQGILGTIGFANGQFLPSTANVFLINPAGIIFGPGAELDVGGSFVATTAHGLKFGTLGEFSATNPQPPSPLLTINPSALFVNQLAASQPRPGNIQVNGSFLFVPNSQSLLLVGGDVQLDNAAVGVFGPGGGRVELGGITGPGQVDLTLQGNEWRLGFLVGIARGDVQIRNQSRVNLLGETGGSLAIHTRNLEILEGSRVLGGIANGSGTTTSQAGDIEVDATGEIQIRQSSVIANLVGIGATGNSGKVVVRAKSLTLAEGSILGSQINGLGNGGNVEVTAEAITLDRPNSNGNRSAIISEVSAIGRGKGGDVTIQAGVLTITNGAGVSATTFGTGRVVSYQEMKNLMELIRPRTKRLRHGSPPLSAG